MYYKKGVEIMAISLRLTDDEAMLFKQFADMKKISVSELIRQTVLERIEDEIDLVTYQKAIVEHKSNPHTYSLDEVEKELGL